jgi:hypothetical protein
VLHSTKYSPIFVLSREKNPETKKEFKTFKIDFMRTDNTTLFAEISNDHINQMVKEVKETVASEHQQENGRNIFSTADLWRIQKNRRMRVQRRMIF